LDSNIHGKRSRLNGRQAQRVRVVEGALCT